MKRPTQWCDSCESTVYTDDVHSCYDAKRGREEQDARDRVVEAAVALAATMSFSWAAWPPGTQGTSTTHCDDAKGVDLWHAVRALRAVRGEL